MPIELKTKGVEIIERINTLAAVDAGNEFKIHALRREAEKLAEVDAYSAYTALGALASFEKNLADIQQSLELL